MTQHDALSHCTKLEAVVAEADLDVTAYLGEDEYSITRAEKKLRKNVCFDSLARDLSMTAEHVSNLWTMKTLCDFLRDHESLPFQSSTVARCMLEREFDAVCEAMAVIAKARFTSDELYMRERFVEATVLEFRRRYQ